MSSWCHRWLDYRPTRVAPLRVSAEEWCSLTVDAMARMMMLLRVTQSSPLSTYLTASDIILELMLKTMRGILDPSLAR